MHLKRRQYLLWKCHTVFSVMISIIRVAFHFLCLFSFYPLQIWQWLWEWMHFVFCVSLFWEIWSRVISWARYEIWPVILISMNGNWRDMLKDTCDVSVTLLRKNKYLSLVPNLCLTVFPDIWLPFCLDVFY